MWLVLSLWSSGHSSLFSMGYMITVEYIGYFRGMVIIVYTFNCISRDQIIRWSVKTLLTSQIVSLVT